MAAGCCRDHHCKAAVLLGADSFSLKKELTQVVPQDAVEAISAEQHARQALTVRILELEDAQGKDAGLREAQLEKDLQEVSAPEHSAGIKLP